MIAAPVASLLEISSESQERMQSNEFYSFCNTELTQQQKDENQALAKVRIVVEHAIGGLKRYYILRNENRIKKPEENLKLDMAVELCAALWNFKRGFTKKYD